MGKLIDVDGFENDLIEKCEIGRQSLRNVVNILKEQPIVDAVEVVRCENCHYCGIYKSGNLYCVHQNGITNPKPDEFCSHGERRNDERQEDRKSD